MKKQITIIIGSALLFLFTLPTFIFAVATSHSLEIISSQELTLDQGMIAVSGVFFFFHLLLFLANPKDMGALYFGLFCLFIGGLVLPQSKLFLVWFSMEFPKAQLIRTILGIAASLSLLFYISIISKILKEIMLPFLFFGFAVLIFILATPPSFLPNTYLIYRIGVIGIVLANIGFIAKLLFWGEKGHKREAIFLLLSILFGLIVLVGSIITCGSDYLANSCSNPIGKKIPQYLVYLSFFITQGLLLTNRFRNKLKSEIQQKELY